LPALVNLRVFADDVAVADDDSVAGDVALSGGVFEGAHFGRRPDDHACTDPVAVADCGRPGDDDVGADGVAVAEGDVVADDRGRVDVVAHRAPLWRFMCSAWVAGTASIVPLFG